MLVRMNTKPTTLDTMIVESSKIERKSGLIITATPYLCFTSYSMQDDPSYVSVLLTNKALDSPILSYDEHSLSLVMP